MLLRMAKPKKGFFLIEDPCLVFESLCPSSSLRGLMQLDVLFYVFSLLLAFFLLRDLVFTMLDVITMSTTTWTVFIEASTTSQRISTPESKPICYFDRLSQAIHPFMLVIPDLLTQ